MTSYENDTIDLGDVVEETKGGGVQGQDSLGLKQIGAGLSDD